ncbi:autotransporter domain-containing protein [Phascolarctobacterium faecium]|uniref:autotransporter domain-containing protein n=1 Tax=Phascolarctobacterium faecium TaxID=33025 RepID=UPI003FEDB426
MMRSKRLAKNKDLQKKVLCSLLAVGVMSVCISGGDVWAAGTIKDQDMVITSNMDIVADDGGFEGATNRYAAIGHTQDATMTVTAKPGVIVNSVVTATNGRAMGIVNTGNGVLNVNGNYGFALQADTVRGIRNNGYNDLNLNGDFIIKAVSEGKDSNNDVVVGAEAFNGTNITVNGDKLNIDITTDNARIIGVQNFNNNGKTIVFNSNDISIKAVQTGTGSFCQGVLGYQSTTNFNGDIVIDLKADKVTSQVHGVDIQCDPGNTYETAVNFNNQQTDIKVEGGAGATVAAIRASGVPGTVNLNGKVTNLTAANINGGMAAAIISQYGAHVNSGSETNINAAVNAKDDAVAVYVGEYAGYNGNVELQGNFTADVISENGDAYGILGELSDDAKSEDDGKIYIGKDLELDVTAANGDAVGIGVSGKYNKTIILGNSTINATGKTASNALLAEAGGQITVGSEGKTVDLKAETTGGRVVGLEAKGGSNITVNGDKLVLDLTSNVENGTASDRIIGIESSANKGGKITVNSAETFITAVQNGVVKYGHGVRGNMSTIDFNGNVAIDLQGEQVNSQLAGAYIQCDPSDSHTTAINFNGGKTNIKVQGGADYLFAVQGSGVPGSINFTGEKVDLKAVNTGTGTAAGIYAQYGATINSAAATDIVTTVETNGYANGIYNTNNFGYNGNVKLNGNFTATVKSNDKSAYGIYNDPLAADNTGGEVYIGKDLKLDVTALKGEAVGIYGEGEYSKTTVLGDVTITTNGQNDSYSLYAADKANITLGSAGKTVALTGDVTAKDSDSIIRLAGDTNIVSGTVTADAGGIVLAGSDKATYIVNKFVTKDSVSRFTTVTRGTITVSGGTLNIDNLSDINKFDLADNSLIVTGKGVLKAASDKVFEADTSGKKVIAGVDQKVLFNGGKLAISDTSYTLADSKVYSEALGKVDDSGVGANTKTTIVMTGTLQDQPVDNKATVDDLAPTGAVHTNVTGTVSTGTLNVGDGSSSEGATGVNNDLGVKDLDFTSVSGPVDVKVNISNDTALTLVGDGSGDLLKGTAATGNVVSLGSASSAGTLNLGVAGITSGGALNADVAIGHADSQLSVEGGAFTVQKITAEQGTVAVGSGSSLATDSLTIGSSNDTKTAAIEAAGTLTVKELTLNKGTVAVTGAAVADKLTASADATISVGSSVAAGSLQAANVKLSGASVMLDPAWDASGNQIAGASKAGLDFIGAVDGKLTVGQNSVLTLGETDTSKAEKVFADTGLIWGQNDITAALYIDYEQTMDSTKGGIKVDGSLTHASDSKDLAAANTATFAAGSLLMVAGDAALTMDGALKAGGTATITISNGSAATLKVDSGAKLYIADAQADKQYTIVSGFTNSGSAVTDGGWNGTNLLLNKLVKGSGSYSSGSFTVSTQKVKASEALPGVALPNILDAMSSQTDSPYAGIKYLSNAISGLNSNAQTLAAVNSFAQGAENSGATRTGALAAMDLGTAAQEHLSLAKAAAEQSGGFGKAAVDTADNGSIWAQYIHNKDKVDNMGGVSYDGQYNGVIIGGDFADRGKYSSGMAFSYGSGDSTGSASKNEFDFWGLSYYGGIQNGDTNLIFDVGYSKTSSDVKGVIKAEPDTQVISMGIKGEKLISNGHGTSYVPYAGLRYMNIDTDSYNGSIDGKTAAHYSTDKADLWLLPVGISISHESVTASGWKVRPTADIAYVWTLGDKNTAMDITVPGVNATDRLGYDIMDSGFFVGKLGLEAEKGDWTYGLGYACQKGSHAQNSKFMLNVTYSF